MTPPTADNTDMGALFYRPRKLMNGLTGVNPVQLYVDFTLHRYTLTKLENAPASMAGQRKKFCAHGLQH